MKIIFTVGDANGIGIEVMFKALKALPASFFEKHAFSIVGNEEVISEYLRLIKADAQIQNNCLLVNDSKIPVLNIADKFPLELGKLSSASGRLAAQSIRYAASKCLSGEYDCMVTMPISKEAMHLAGEPFPGHTEMLAHICGVKKPLMILCSENIRVALATIHIPLKDVPASISKEGLNKTALLFEESLKKDYGIKNPKIACLSLNPHAGEGGDIGSEESDIIEPAIQNLQNMKADVQGPFASDGFFAHGDYKNYDGILAMYHDQGLIPLKLLAEGAGVNFTAGLPIVRTSPDHGTAFNLAGKNIADAKSAIEAIKLAVSIAEKRSASR